MKYILFTYGKFDVQGLLLKKNHHWSILFIDPYNGNKTTIDIKNMKTFMTGVKHLR